MNSKQKLVIGIVGGILLLAVIGLTIGLVLVAGMGSVGSSMRVTYVAKDVACTIKSSAQIYNGDDSKNGNAILPTPEYIKIKPTAANNAEMGSMIYEDEIKIDDNGTAYVIFTIEVVNDADPAGVSRPIMAVGEMNDQATNMKVTLDSSRATNISAGESGFITATMKIVNPTLVAKFEGSMKITVSLIEE